MAAAAEEQRNDPDAGHAAVRERPDGAREIWLHVLEKRQGDGEIGPACLDPRPQPLERLGPTDVASAVGEQDDSAVGHARL